MGVRPWWGRNPCLLLSRCPKFGKRLRGQFYRSAFCRFPMDGPHREPIPKCSLPPNLAGVWSDLGTNSGQVSFERTEALACWELAPAPSGLAYPLAPTVGIVRGTLRASRGGSTRACVPATHPQVVAPGPSSSVKLGQRQCLRQGVQPPKEPFWPKGPVRSDQTMH